MTLKQFILVLLSSSRNFCNDSTVVCATDNMIICHCPKN